MLTQRCVVRRAPRASPPRRIRAGTTMPRTPQEAPRPPGELLARVPRLVPRSEVEARAAAAHVPSPPMISLDEHGSCSTSAAQLAAKMGNSAKIGCALAAGTTFCPSACSRVARTPGASADPISSPACVGVSCRKDVVARAGAWLEPRPWLWVRGSSPSCCPKRSGRGRGVGGEKEVGRKFRHKHVLVSTRP